MTTMHDQGAGGEAARAAARHHGPTADRWNSALERYLAAVGAPTDRGAGSAADHLVVERLADHRVADVMTAPAVSVPPTAPFKQIVQLIAGRRISAVPVVADSGEVVGLVSETDLLAHVVDAEGHQ